jgi:hypothetical protein
MPQTVHRIKSWPTFFRPIITGERAHELRRNDRDFHVGDILRLQEYDPISQSYTGATCDAEVTSMTSDEMPCAVSDEGLRSGFCILTIRVVSNHIPSSSPARIELPAAVFD